MESTLSFPHLTRSRVIRVLFLALLIIILWLLLPMILLQPTAPDTHPTGKLNVHPAQVRATGGLTITKTANRSQVAVGESITYRLVVSNETGSDISGGIPPVVVTDTIPTYTRCDPNAMGAPADWSFDCVNNTAAWLLNGTFTDGTSVVLTFSVTVDEVVPFGVEIRNDDYAFSSGSAGDVGTTVVTTPVDAPQWSLRKQIDNPSGNLVAPGEDITYRLIYGNSGNAQLNGTYVLTDTVPPFTTLITTSLAHTNYSGITPGSLITWTFSSALNPGQERNTTFRIQVSSPLTKDLLIVNEAFGIRGGNAFAGASGTPVTLTVASKPILAVSKRLLNPRVGPGDQITYRLSYTNSGNAIAQSVRLTDTLPANVSYQSATPTPSSVNGRTIAWLFDSLPPGGPQTIDLVADVAPATPDGTIITNTVVISSPTTDANTDTFALSTTVRLRPDLVVAIEATPAGPFLPTDLVTYTMVYTNDGNQLANEAILTTTLGKAALVSVQTRNADILLQSGSTVVIQHQGVLTPGVTGSLTVVGRLVESPWAPGGEFFTARTVGRMDAEEIRDGNNIAQVSRQAGPDEPVSGVLEPGGEVPTGEDVLLRVQGNDVYNNLAPDGTPVSFEIGPIGEISGTGTETRNGVVTGTIRSDIAGSARLTATLGSNDLQLTQDVIFVPPALSIEKTASADPVAPGAPLVYTIVVSNSGGPNAGQARSVVLSDTFPGNRLNFVAASLTPTVVGDVYRFELGDLGAEAAATVRLTTTVRNDAPDLSLITNTAQARSSSLDGSVGATDVTQVLIPVLEKSVMPAVVGAGDLLTYTLTYQNKGATPVNVRLTDTLPVQVIFQSADPDPALNTGSEVVFTRNGLPGGEQFTVTLVTRARSAPWGVQREPVVNTAVAVNNLDPEPQTASATAQGGPGAPANISLVVADTFAPGGTVPVQVSVRDAFDNPVLDGTIITLTVNAPGQLDDLLLHTENGEASTTLRSNEAANLSLNAAAGNVQTVENITVATPSLALEKIAIPARVAPGSRLVYRFIVTNTGSLESYNVTLTDPLADELQFVRAEPNAAATPDGYRFNLGTLAAGETRTLLLTATVNAPLAAGTQINNTAALSATGLVNPVEAGASSEVFIPVLRKFATPDVVRAGEEITYTIVYENRTGSELQNVRLTDRMPDEIAALVRSDPGVATIIDDTLPDLTFEQASLPAGETITLTLVGRLQNGPWPPSLVDFVNAVTATNTPTVETWSVVNSGRPNEAAQLSLSFSPASAVAGQRVAATVTVADAFGNAVLNTTPISLSVSAPGVVLTPSLQTQDGQARTFISSNDPGTRIVTATVGSRLVTDSITFATPDAVALAVQKQLLTERPTPGSNLNYEIRVDNVGTTGLSGLVVTDTLSNNGFNLGDLSADQDFSQPAANVLVFNLPTLNAGLGQTIRLTVPVAVSTEVGTLLTNTVQVDASGLPNPITRLVTTTVQEMLSVAADLSQSVTPNPVLAGEILTYTLRYSNSGSLPITNLVLTNTFANQIAGLVYSDTGGTLLQSATLPVLVFRQNNLAVGDSLTITLAARITETGWSPNASAAANLISNQLVARSDQQTNLMIAQPAQTRGQPGPAVTLSLQADVLRATVGQTIPLTAQARDQFQNPVLNGTGLSFSITPPGTFLQADINTQNGNATARATAVQSGSVTVTVTLDSLSHALRLTFTSTSTTTPPIDLPFAAYLPLVIK